MALHKQTKVTAWLAMPPGWAKPTNLSSKNDTRHYTHEQPKLSPPNKAKHLLQNNETLSTR
jgi:hypothetical protein